MAAKSSRPLGGGKSATWPRPLKNWCFPFNDGLPSRHTGISHPTRQPNDSGTERHCGEMKNASSSRLRRRMVPASAKVVLAMAASCTFHLSQSTAAQNWTGNPTILKGTSFFFSVKSSFRVVKRFTRLRSLFSDQKRLFRQGYLISLLFSLSLQSVLHASLPFFFSPALCVCSWFRRCV